MRQRSLTMVVLAGLLGCRQAGDSVSLEDLAEDLLGQPADDVRRQYEGARDTSWTTDLGNGGLALLVPLRGTEVMAPPCLDYEVSDGGQVRMLEVVRGPVWEIVSVDSAVTTEYGLAIGSTMGSIRATGEAVTIVAYEDLGWYASLGDGRRYEFRLDRFDREPLKRHELWEDGTLARPELLPDSARIGEMRLRDLEQCADEWTAAAESWETRGR